ncbi:MAG: ATP-binding cassette domain-containing protein [Verrucomicrobiota bacterium]
MNAVELENISKSFGSVLAVAQLSLQVPEGTIYGFIGPNGSGKTTTLRVLLNIFKPDAGAVRLFGNPSLGVRDPRLGYLPEERGLYRRMNVRELLCFFGKLKTGRLLEREVDTWLERFGLREWGGKKLETLSKGMAQKVQFIVAVLGEPRLLVLDEPFSGLDPVNMDVLREAVLDLRARGATVLFSTHDMSMAERMCDFICMIFQGRKVLDGTLRSIQDQFGADTVRLRVDGGAARLHDLPGVEHLDDFGQVQELRLRPGADPQQILAHLVARIPIQSFELTRPSLHDIFVRIAGPAAKEATHA